MIWCVSLFLNQVLPTQRPLAMANSKILSTICVTGTKAMSTMDGAEHTSRSADLTISVTNWDKYLSGWDLGNRVLQLVLEAFLFRLR